MSSFVYGAGLSNVGSYQVSGIPYATGSLCPIVGSVSGMSVSFPYVTRWVEVYNHDVTNPLFIGFSSNGINKDKANNYFIELPPATTQMPVVTTGRMELKLTQIWLSGSGIGSCGVYAGLTNLPIARLDDPNGTNWTGSAGVG
tara:strand:+ start:2052 stop:2480 length:429 start_codon:yes stop_codon:yes gene_type:complete